MDPPTARSGPRMAQVKRSLYITEVKIAGVKTRKTSTVPVGAKRAGTIRMFGQEIILVEQRDPLTAGQFQGGI